MKTIVIFAKAPRPGRVKTRLAADLGAKNAVELYKAMAIDTVAVARAVSGVRVLIAYDGKNPKWLGNHSWFSQRGRTLGERLIHAFNHVFRFSGGPVVIVGSDLPALTPPLLSKAFRALRESSVVLGPSRDGGYYLIGLRSAQPQLFRRIAWSHPNVLRRTIHAVRKSKLSCRMLRLEQDIDRIKDVERFKKSARQHRTKKYFQRTRDLLELC